MFVHLVACEPKKDLLIFDAVHIDRYVVEIFELRNVFERYRKLDICKIQHSCIMRMTIFYMTFSWI